MYTVALTGGIASGKSTAERLFAALGVEILDADLIAREVVAPGSEGLARIVEAFGTSALTADGTLDRKAMRERVFADAPARRTLESIIHPRVRATLKSRAQAAGGPYVMLVIPLFVESGDYAWVDRVLVVDVPRETQIDRLIARDGISREQAEAMLDAQATREQRLAAADDVIDNRADPDSLKAAVELLHRRYLQLAG
ncbi:MAG: dephospho-CoA kinase [Gammaproteobacteria bacterium]|nr:MAG: dephospho-CoA kinase [Gammaproteobacteria bacterium]